MPGMLGARRGRGRGAEAWNGSWNGAPGNTSAACAVSAMIGSIGAASACVGSEQALLMRRSSVRFR